MTTRESLTIDLHSIESAIALVGEQEANLRIFAAQTGATLVLRGRDLYITGTPAQVQLCQQLIQDLGTLWREGRPVSGVDILDMISSNDFRPGVSIELDGAVWRVVEFLHVKPGKGSAFVRTKLKNVQTGNVIERTFRAGETVPQATLEKRTMQHTYKDGEDYVFMDMESYEEARLTPAQVGDRAKYLKEGMEVNIVKWGEQVLEVELPNSVVLEVVQTDPGVKGDTATGGSKPAIVETGAQVMVPLFISVGERIRIDTRSDTYLGRE